MGDFEKAKVQHSKLTQRKKICIYKKELLGTAEDTWGGTVLERLAFPMYFLFLAFYWQKKCANQDQPSTLDIN